MSTLKNLDENVEAVEDEEKEHSRLMKEQERFENESIHDMPNIDDDEYARMIGISESLGRGDEKMTDQDIEDEEEKKPLKYRKHSRREYEQIDNEDEEDDEVHNNESSIKIKSGFDSYENSYKKQSSPLSSFTKRAGLTRDTESSSKFQTPQRYQNAISYNQNMSSSNKAQFSSQRDLNEEFRQEVVQLVKVRVEELQSKMKSKSDMYYVLRHMCKRLNRLSI